MRVMGCKIIQIIPINKEMYAIYDSGRKTFITCLALIEYENGERIVHLMDIDNKNGFIDIVDDLVEIEYGL